MAKDRFDTSKIYRCRLWGINFEYFPGSPGNSPELPGTFAADTVETSGQPGNVDEFAVFTVSEPSGNEYPASWVGTYRLPYGKIVENPPIYVADVPEPDPDPDPEPEPEPDPDDDSEVTPGE